MVAGLLCVVAWGSQALATPPEPLEFEPQWACEAGLLRSSTPVVEHGGRLSLSGDRGVLIAADGRSALHHGLLSTTPQATLYTCRGDELRTLRVERDALRPDGVDVARVDPGLDQMGWFQFTPDGQRLVFAMTAHHREPGPNGGAPYAVTTLMSQLVVIPLDTLKSQRMDLMEVGFNRHRVADDHVWVQGRQATWRVTCDGVRTPVPADEARILWNDAVKSPVEPRGDEEDHP